jgi:hypothetical protein
MFPAVCGCRQYQNINCRACCSHLWPFFLFTGRSHYLSHTHLSNLAQPWTTLLRSLQPSTLSGSDTSSDLIQLQGHQGRGGHAQQQANEGSVDWVGE